MTWQEAEAVAWGWMINNGFPDARMTPAGADGGVDVESKAAVAQVKHHAKPVGLSEVQRIYAIAISTGRAALFFSSSGFTTSASAWARANGVQMYSLPYVKSVP